MHGYSYLREVIQAPWLLLRSSSNKRGRDADDDMLTDVRLPIAAGTTSSRHTQYIPLGVSTDQLCSTSLLDHF